MKVEQLNEQHPEYSIRELTEARDLFEGGSRMRKNVGAHLVRNDLEDVAMFKRRCQSAHYLNYCGPIGGYFAAFVASQPITFGDQQDADYWSDLAKDADAKGTDFNTFLTGRMIEALTTSKAFWRVHFREPELPVEALSDVREQGSDRAIVVPIPTEEIIDWDRDDEGRYLWMRQSERRCVRRGAGQKNTTILTWTEWRNDGTSKRWQTEYEGDGIVPDSSDVDEVKPPYNPVAEIPIVSLELPQALYLMGHLASPQLESFRKRCALAWSIERTCYAMPWFFLEDAKSPPVMGAGYYGIVGAKDRVEWPTPPSTPYATIGEYNATLVQELHRVAQAMARGADNNAPAAIGRSGESKKADDRATEIVVAEYADRLREVGQKTVDVIAKGASRGEAPTCGGLSGYSILDATATIEQFLGLQSAKIHSVTAMKEAEKLVTRAYLPELTEETRKKVDQEIEATLSAEELDAARQPVDINVPPPGVTPVPADKTQTAKLPPKQ